MSLSPQNQALVERLEPDDHSVIRVIARSNPEQLNGLLDAARLEALTAGADADRVLVPTRITPEMAHALESNFAACIPPAPVHAANWQEAWTKALAARPDSAEGGA